jgi:hypothetical protein
MSVTKYSSKHISNREKASLEKNTSFEIQTYYDDSETLRIVRSIASLIGQINKFEINFDEILFFQVKRTMKRGKYSVRF